MSSTHRQTVDYSCCDGDEYGHLPHCDVPTQELVADRNRYIRLFNRLEAAVSHHKKAHTPEGRYFADDPDEALWKARDKILTDACEGKG